MAIKIQTVSTLEDCQKIEQLQMQIWQSPEIEVVPDHMLLTFALNQGIVLLAMEDDLPLGFAFGFQGTTKEGHRAHISHQLGVLPSAQNKNLGYQLKLAQRDLAISQGLDLMIWTFDPLLSRNAQLNFGKLGVINRHYIRNLYGDMRNKINNVVESDRFKVEWWLTHPTVEQKLAGSFSQREVDAREILNPCVVDSRGFLIPPKKIPLLSAARYFVQIPIDIDAVKNVDPNLANAWRLHTRKIFETAIANKYIVTDFIFLRTQQKAYYLLTLRSR